MPVRTQAARQQSAESALCVQVRSIAVDSTGQWLASGGQDGALCLWDALTGRRTATWQLGEAVRCVAWCPSPGLRLLSACSGRNVYLVPTGMPLAHTISLQACQQLPAG